MASAMHENLVTNVGGDRGRQERETLFAIGVWADELGLVVKGSLEDTCLQVWLEGEETALKELERRCSARGVNLLKIPETEEF